MISEADLILNKDGSIYHLSLLPSNVVDTIITVGDPGRVHEVSKYFDEITFEMNIREFITHVGRINNKNIMVMSTGMGTDNIEIVLSELDALVNIDLKERKIKDRKRKLNIIRVGTSGSLQQDVPLDSFLISENAVGFDNLMNFYDLPQSTYEQRVTAKIQADCNLPFTPYMAGASPKLLKQFSGNGFIMGNTVTCPGFYGPQGRKLRLDLKYPRLLDDLNKFHDEQFWLTNFEMETAGYYSFGRLLGHHVISINAIIANRMQNKFSKQPKKTVDLLIQKVLELL
ncbi:MAG: nucleoside phosphorylase [Candidatus Cyclobacteriaceae bacterium M2_1C_046]